jgi:hypothetical protein
MLGDGREVARVWHQSSSQGAGTNVFDQIKVLDVELGFEGDLRRLLRAAAALATDSAMLFSTVLATSPSC